MYVCVYDPVYDQDWSRISPINYLLGFLIGGNIGTGKKDITR
jgi:hypothetical protein